MTTVIGHENHVNLSFQTPTDISYVISEAQE